MTCTPAKPNMSEGRIDKTALLCTKTIDDEEKQKTQNRTYHQIHSSKQNVNTDKEQKTDAPLLAAISGPL